MVSLLIFLILGLSLILNLLLGFFVLFKNPKNVIHVTFFFFVLGVVGWGASILSLLIYGADIIAVRMTFSFAAIMLAGFLLFSVVFPFGQRKNKLFYPIIFLGAAFSALPLAGNFIVKNVAVAGNFITIDFGHLYGLYVIFAPFCIIGSLIILINKYIKSKSIQRLQLKYLFFGGLLFLIPAVMTNLLLPTFFNIWQYNGLGPSFSIFMVSAITYAIVRYHLMDIWVVVRLGTIFTILLATISFIYVYIGSMIGQFFPHTIAHIITSLIITVGFIPLKNFIEFSTDKIFFKKRYKFANIIGEAEEIIRQSGLDLDKILENFNRAITGALKVKEAVILILIPKDHFISRQIIGDIATEINLKPDNPIISYFESNKGHTIDAETLRPDSVKNNSNILDAVRELKQTGFSFAVPIEYKDELIGIHLFGPKMSLDPFTKEDISLLKHLSGEMAFAIENARMFEELKKLDQTKSEFISVASHQLRTPVSIIRWNLELAMDKETSEQEKGELLRTVYENSDEIGHQLDKLMTAFEIEDRNIFIDKKEKCLKSLVLEHLKKNENVFKNKNLIVEIDFASDLPETINYDYDKVSKTIDTLIQNAITYTPAGGKIKVGARKEKLKEKGFLIIFISDNGIGIDEHDCGNIFKKFFRSQGARYISPNGFGLGLFIAKKFINAHGGDIWFEANKENKGTTFYFSIPLETNDDSQRPAANS